MGRRGDKEYGRTGEMAKQEIGETKLGRSGENPGATL